MKVILLRDARIKHLKGETVEVSAEEAAFLINTQSAVLAAAPKEKKTRKK